MKNMTFKSYEFGGKVYQVDEEGYLLKLNGERLVRTRLKRGYEQYVTRDSAGKVHCELLHRVIYKVLIVEIPDGMTVDHIDNDWENNNPSNLQLLTRSQNSKKDKFKTWFLINDKECIITTRLSELCSERGWSQGCISRAASIPERTAYGYKVFKGSIG